MNAVDAKTQLLAKFADAKPDTGVRLQDARYAQYHNAEVSAWTKADQAGRQTSEGDFWCAVAKLIAEEYHDGSAAAKEEQREARKKLPKAAGVGAPALHGLSS